MNRNLTPVTYLERVLDRALRLCCEHMNPDRPEFARAIAVAAAIDDVAEVPREGFTVRDTRLRVFKQGESVEMENL